MYEYNATVINVFKPHKIDLEIDLGFGITKKCSLPLARIETPSLLGSPKLLGFAGPDLEYEKAVATIKFIKDYVKQTQNEVKIVIVKKNHKYYCEVFAKKGQFSNTNLNNELVTYGFATEQDTK